MTSHKAKRKKPQLIIHSTPSTVTARSNDNRRQRTFSGLVAGDVGPAAGPSTEFWADDLTANAACLGGDFTYCLGDDSLESQFDDQLDNGANLDDGINVVATKVPRNLNSVCPFFLSVAADLRLKLGSSAANLVPALR
jgi:hypothetical protein